MSQAKKMIIRVQSPEGTARVELSPTECTAALYERVREQLALSSFEFALYRDRARTEALPSSRSRSLAAARLAHGDLLYLSAVDGAAIFADPAPAPATTPAVPSTSAHSTQMIETPTARSSTAPPAPAVQEDDVDIELYNTPGTIQRQRDEKLCRHNSKGCCVHCSPLEPWDEGYLKEQNIKHLSFHSYLRKMQAKNFIALEEPSFEIKPGCTEHPPWPRGICSKCQPGAVTLNRQVYRHVDNVVLESGALVDRFLGYWRATGRQRVGWLYGRYERHPAVPLGVRARVAAIYEPAQRGTRDHVALLPDDKQPALDAVAARLGLTRLGWIFTDLVPEAAGAGAVRHVRAPSAHPPLSAQEVLTAAHLQNERPSACRHAAAGVFGSKQVTVCVSGDERRQVALEGYQVSAQAAALQRAGLLVPTKDAPELLHVREAEAGAGAGGGGGGGGGGLATCPTCASRSATRTATRWCARRAACPWSTCWWTCRAGWPRRRSPRSRTARRRSRRRTARTPAGRSRWRCWRRTRRARPRGWRPCPTCTCCCTWRPTRRCRWARRRAGRWRRCARRWRRATRRRRRPGAPARCPPRWSSCCARRPRAARRPPPPPPAPRPGPVPCAPSTTRRTTTPARCARCRGEPSP